MTQVQGYKAGRVARLRRHPLTFVFGFPLTGRGFLTPQLVWLGIAVRAPFSVLTGFESTLLMVLWPVCAVAATWRARVVDGTLICTTFGIRTLVIDLRRSGECRLVSLPVVGLGYLPTLTFDEAWVVWRVGRRRLPRLMFDVPLVMTSGST
ncbi:MAG TPA: hypothetical protein PKA24_20210, partial [Microthrixaceae bacterium]|nr:hypothetical protein [Microthrixaceae bacterium]